MQVTDHFQHNQFWVRHASKGRSTEYRDDPELRYANDFGVSRLKAAIEASYGKISHIKTSPYLRTRQTANLFNVRNRLHREIDLQIGEYHVEIPEVTPQTHRYAPIVQESFTDFEARILAVAQRGIFNNTLHVTHGRVITQLLEALGYDFELYPLPLSGFVMSCSGEIRFFGEWIILKKTPIPPISNTAL